MKAILTSLLMLISVSSFSASNTWHKSKIDKIYPQGNGGLILTLKNPSPDCNRTDHYHYILDKQNGVNQSGINSMLSVALAAAALDKEVNLYFDRDSSNCYVNRLFVDF